MGDGSPFPPDLPAHLRPVRRESCGRPTPCPSTAVVPGAAGDSVSAGHVRPSDAPRDEAPSPGLPCSQAATGPSSGLMRGAEEGPVPSGPPCGRCQRDRGDEVAIGSGTGGGPPTPDVTRDIRARAAGLLAAAERGPGPGRWPSHLSGDGRRSPRPGPPAWTPRHPAAVSAASPGRTLVPAAPGRRAEPAQGRDGLTMARGMTPTSSFWLT